MNDFLYKTSLAVVPRLYVSLTALWFRTCPVQIRGKENLQRILDQGAAVVPFWHYSVFYMLYHLRQYPGVAMVSASRDGEYIARLAHHLNFATIRGSRNRRGMRALKELIAWIQKGGNVGIVADGSQGPALIAQPGAIMLASRTGAPILPLAWSASRYLRFKSWDRTAIPTPFATIDFYYGKPLWMPPKVTAAAVEPYRQELEASLNRLYRKAWRRYGQEAH